MDKEVEELAQIIMAYKSKMNATDGGYTSHEIAEVVLKAGYRRPSPQGQVDGEALNKIRAEVEEDFGVEEYELRADNGDYTPNKYEKMLMHDFHEGFMEEFILRLLAQTPQPPPAVMWPEKLDIFKRSPDGNYRDGANAMHDAFMSIIEGLPRATGLDKEALRNLWDKVKGKWANNTFYNPQEIMDFIDAICAKFGNSSSTGLVPLDELKVLEWFCNKGYAEKKGWSYSEMLHELCAKFGTPKIPTVEEIQAIIDDYVIRNGEKGKWPKPNELANAIHDALEAVQGKDKKETK